MTGGFQEDYKFERKGKKEARVLICSCSCSCSCSEITIKSKIKIKSTRTRDLPRDIQENGIGKAKRVFAFDRRENRTGDGGLSDPKDLRVEDVVDTAIQSIPGDGSWPCEIAGAVKALVECAVKISSKTILDEIFGCLGGY